MLEKNKVEPSPQLNLSPIPTTEVRYTRDLHSLDRTTHVSFKADDY